MRIGCQACGMLACICPSTARHKPDCQFLRALACPVGIECDHGRDVCPVCDPCSCGVGITIEDTDGSAVLLERHEKDRREFERADRARQEEQ